MFKSNQTPKTSNPVDPHAPNVGSGAEQDRFGSHFTLPAGSADKIKSAASNAIHASGSGAEQDRYRSHFSLDGQKVKDSVNDLLKKTQGGHAGAGPDFRQNNFGLGYDGQQMVKALANAQGVGAEQDRFGAHFEGIGDAAIQKAKEQFQK